jgi:hypothetical protein
MTQVTFSTYIAAASVPIPSPVPLASHGLPDQPVDGPEVLLQSLREVAQLGLQSSPSHIVENEGFNPGAQKPPCFWKSWGGQGTPSTSRHLSMVEATLLATSLSWVQPSIHDLWVAM